MLPTYKQTDGAVLRAGYTTGTCAAAAASAAVQLLYNRLNRPAVEVDTPAGVRLTLPLALQEAGEGWARAGVRKDAGDDPDVTHGIVVVALAKPLAAGEICLDGGEGVGRVTKPGLSVSVGQAAINPVPRCQIMAAIQAVLCPSEGVVVTISVPGGEELAKRTLNPELGIIGGISILGTTGIVEPMSADACKRSLVPQIDVALAAGCRRLVLTPGKMGKRNVLSRLPVQPEAVVTMSNFVGTMLEACVAKGIKEVLLFGHIGKLVKVAAGIFDTHSKIADARRETLVAHGALAGLPLASLQALMAHNTADESAGYLISQGYDQVLTAVAEAAARRTEAMVKGKLRAGCVMLNLAGEILAADTWGSLWLEDWEHA